MTESIGLWILRMVALLITCVVVVLVVGSLVPKVEATAIRADVLAGRVVYNGGIFLDVGVVSEQQFVALATRSVSPDDFVGYPKDTYVPVTVIVTVYDAETGIPLHPIQRIGPGIEVQIYEVIYNKPAYDKLRAFEKSIVAGDAITRVVRVLPATMQRIDGSFIEVLVHVEVLHGK